jgi:hypothetical protein
MATPGRTTTTPWLSQVIDLVIVYHLAACVGLSMAYL